MNYKSEYIPKLTDEDIKENHKHFSERMSVYKRKGLDFTKVREFILTKAYPLQGNILEIGAGNGHATLILAKSGYKFISVDKDKEALKIAALNLAYENVLSNVKFYVMDGKSLTFTDSSFKNVVIVNLFHHIDNVNALLLEADRVLCADGKLILADFNKRGMKIVNAVHRQEGRVHRDVGMGRDYIYSYFHGLGYEIKNYKEKCHWILLAKKQIQP